MGNNDQREVIVPFKPGHRVIKASLDRLDPIMIDAVAKLVAALDKLHAALPHIVLFPAEEPSEQTKAIARSFDAAFR